MIFLTEDLISSIKVRTLAPISQQTFTETNLISLLNEEMMISLVPDIISARENYFLRTDLISIEANDNEINIPNRAIGGALREIFYIQNNSRIRLPQKKISDLEFNLQNGEPQAFYLKDNKVCLWPTPSSSVGQIEIWYYARPSDLVPTSKCGKIDNITSDSTTVTLTLNTDLSATLANGAYIDIVSIKSPNQLQVFNAAIQSISGVTVTLLLSDCIDSNGTIRPQLGDYLCATQTSNIPQIPVELQPILAQMVAARIVEALGDGAKIQMVNAKLAEMRSQAFKLISNRVENESIPIINRRGILSHITGGWRR